MAVASREVLVRWLVGRTPHRRGGRAIGWFTDALGPLVPVLAEDGVHRLALAIRSAVGIESLVWLTDVAGMNRDEAAELMEWSAMAMLHAAVDGGI